MITVENLTKSYPTAAGRVPALRDVTFEIAAGCLYGVYGQAGSGKSTLVRLIACVTGPTPESCASRAKRRSSASGSGCAARTPTRHSTGSRSTAVWPASCPPDDGSAGHRWSSRKLAIDRGIDRCAEPTWFVGWFSEDPVELPDRGDSLLMESSDRIMCVASCRVKPGTNVIVHTRYPLLRGEECLSDE